MLLQYHQTTPKLLGVQLIEMLLARALRNAKLTTLLIDPVKHVR